MYPQGRTGDTLLERKKDEKERKNSHKESNTKQ